MKVGVLAATAVFAVVILSVPHTTAFGGEPPSLDWSNLFSVTDLQRVNDIAVDRDGNIYVQYDRLDINSNSIPTITRINTQGGIDWTNTYSCVLGDSGTCTGRQLRFDPFDRIVISITGPGEQSYFIADKSNGTITRTSPNLNGVVTSVQQFDTTLNATGEDIVIAFGGGSRLSLWDAGSETELWDVSSLTGVTGVRYDSVNDAWWVDNDGSGQAQEHANATGTVTNSRANGALRDFIPGARDYVYERGINNTSQAFTVMEEAALSGRLEWHSINATDWTLVSPLSNLPDGGQLNDGSDRATRPDAFQLDQDGRILVCGNFESGGSGFDPFAAQVLTSNNTIHWNVTFSLGGTPTTTRCAFDWGNAFYIVSSVIANEEISVRKYSGGGFNVPTAPAVATLPGEAVVTPTPTVDAGGGVVNFAAAIGFQSAGSQFLFGLVLVVIAMVVVAASIKSFAEGQPVMLAAGVAGIGMAIFNSTIGLWAAWTTVVLVIIASGIVAFIIRRGVFGFGGQGG